MPVTALVRPGPEVTKATPTSPDRKRTRLNSSHSQISYAVFCLKKKKKNKQHIHRQHTSTAPADNYRTASTAHITANQRQRRTLVHRSNTRSMRNQARLQLPHT